MKTNPTVISGNLKGSKLDVNAETTRPLTSRVKQSIFDTVRDYISPNTNLLDLYAGSGSFGIEAISRGVKKVTFIDRDKDAINLLKRNLNRLNISENHYRVIYSGVASEMNKLNEKFDLIFIDAPFNQSSKVPIEDIMNQSTEEGIVIWKIPFDFNFEEMLNKDISIRYQDTIGKNTVLYLSRK